MVYVFMSFASAHTGKNIGCCIVKVENSIDANEECRKLNIMPKECNQVRGYELNEYGFKKQEMKLNKFYSAIEMMHKGFKKESDFIIKELSERVTDN